MSGEETQPRTVHGSGSENGMSNSGFDDLGKAGDHGSTYIRQGGNEQHGSGCAGAYGGNGQPSEQQNVSYSPFLNSTVINQITCKQELKPPSPILSL